MNAKSGGMAFSSSFNHAYFLVIFMHFSHKVLGEQIFCGERIKAKTNSLNILILIRLEYFHKYFVIQNIEMLGLKVVTPVLVINGIFV